MSDKFDLIVIGAGPGGYVCAIRAAQLGLKVACIDKRGAPGGTCLNVGCIPSKALLHASHTYEMTESVSDMGIEIGKAKLNLKKMMEYKKSGIEGNTQGIEYLFKKNKIEYFSGEAEIISANSVKLVLNAGGENILSTKNIVIATGSQTTALPNVEVDEKMIVSSTGALEFTSVPKSLVIVGAGVIGLELGSVWARLGTKVTVVEFLDRITPSMDSEVAKAFQKTLTKQGLTFLLGQKVTQVKKSKSGVEIEIEDVKDTGKTTSLSADRVLVAIGRQPHIDGLGLENVGVKLDTRGCIETDSQFKTNIDGIYAIGDVNTGATLAHKAEEEAVANCTNITPRPCSNVNYDLYSDIFGLYILDRCKGNKRSEEELKQVPGVDYEGKKMTLFSI